MTELTQQDIDNHCARLNISRENLTEFVIPDGVTQIGSWAFSRCSALTSITIPDGVTIIDWGAFGGCTSLTSITIHDSVTKICNNALRRCTALRQIICNHPDLFTNENIDNKFNKLHKFSVFINFVQIIASVFLLVMYLK